MCVLVCLFSLYDACVCNSAVSLNDQHELCSATMATGVSQVLHVDFLCGDRPVRFLVLHAAFTVRTLGKEAGRVTGRG